MGADKSAQNTQMTQNLSAQIVCLSQKVWDFDEKRLHWASIVCGHPQADEMSRMLWFCITYLHQMGGGRV